MTELAELTELTELAELAVLAELAELRWTKCHIAKFGWLSTIQQALSH